MSPERSSATAAATGTAGSASIRRELPNPLFKPVRKTSPQETLHDYPQRPQCFPRPLDREVARLDAPRPTRKPASNADPLV